MCYVIKLAYYTNDVQFKCAITVDAVVQKRN